MEKNKQMALSEEEKAVLLKFHEEKKKRILAELNQIDSKMSQYSKSKRQVEIAFESGNYPKNATIPDKIIFVLRETNRFTNVKDIFDIMVKYEPSLSKDKETSHKKNAHVASAVLSKVKSQSLYRYSENGIFKVGLMEWLDENGEPRQQYK